MTEEVKRGSYKPLWWLIALCAFPYVAGTLYYNYWGQLSGGQTNNYGELVQPVREIRDISLTLLDGQQRSFEDYRRKWMMLYLIDGPCDEACRKNIYFMRQVRKAMADERFRISRLMLVSDRNLVDAELRDYLGEFPGLDVAVVDAGDRDRLLALLHTDNSDIHRKIMLVDPLGNYMMRYPQDPDPKKLLKDVKRLLSVSRIG